MKISSLSRGVAAILAVSLVVAAPGNYAWGQVAAAVRPGSAGSAMAGTSGSISAAPGGFTIPSMSLSGPSLSLSAPSMTLAPSISAPSFSAPSVVSQSAAALAVGVVPSASVPAAPKANAVAALSTAKLSAPAADEKSEGALNRLSSFFDGLISRKPAQDAVSSDGPSDAPRESGLGRADAKQMPVLVTMTYPGSAEAQAAVLEKMSADLGFRLDASFAPIEAPGVVTVRGTVPMARLFALKQYPGVIEIAAASGMAVATPSASVPSVPAAAAAPAAPASENLLRAGFRSVIRKNAMWGAVLLLPLQFALMVAFMGPVTGGIALAGAAAVLKPWMLGTAFGMAASFSFLAPLFNWIPLKLRVGGTYAAAAGLAWTFYSLVPGLPALWVAANLLISLVATRGGLPASAQDAGPIEKALIASEKAAYLNVLGYAATVPILVLGGMPTLAFGILAVTTIVALALALRTSLKVSLPALSIAPPAAPSEPEPEREPSQPAPKPSAKRPAHKPFIPATRVVAALEKLLAADPEAALRAAAASIIDPKERRAEVKIGAQRILAALPLEKTLPHYLDLLKFTARSGVQTSKDVNVDPWWYLQRTALRRLSLDAAALKPGTPELIDVLKASYKDRNPSVRLAAADALTALGVDPGPEVSHESVRREAAPVMAPETAPSAPQPPKQNKVVRWISIGLLTFMFGWMAFGAFYPKPVPPKAPQQIEQTIKSDSAVKAPVDSTVKADPRDAALEQIAKDTKRTADAAERSAKAAEEMAKPKGSFLGTLMWTLLPIILLVWLMRKFMGGGMGGKAGGIDTKPKMDLDKPKARFDDVAGIDESLVEVQEIIDFLRDPARFKKLGARMPKGILMEGPPGTGKTLLARALAGETDATFISISGSDFVELYVGMGARRVRELFETARKNAPAIIFIDEIDAVGKKRGDGGPGQGGNDEREQTINQILKEMDGFDNSSGVLVVAATNRADTLDAALTRPGRFDRKIHVGLPEAMGREAILALHAKKARLGADVDLRLIARRTAGLSGAFLENVINEAALLAARRGADSINAADIDEAVDRATIGGKRSLRLSDALKLRIGRHEVGHVAANLLNEKEEVRVPVNKVTIIPHGSGALGFAESGSEEGDKYLYTRAELEARLDTALGGLVAEEIYYGEWSTGPGSDLEQATRVARAMVQQLGMSPDMGLAQTQPNQYGQSSFGSETDAKALVEINKLLAASKARVVKRLNDNKEKFEALVAALVEKETLSADEIEAILRPKPKP